MSACCRRSRIGARAIAKGDVPQVPPATRGSGRRCRALAHGREAVNYAERTGNQTSKGGAADFLRADLSALAEVRRLAKVVLDRADRLDLLVNNAGIGSAGAAGTRQTSRDGYELRFAVNYLAGFALTRLLLSLLKKSAPARIVNVSSLGQQAIDFSDVMLTRDYTGTRAYCQSKLAQILFTIELAEELEGSGVTVNALHPATYMATTMVRAAGVTPVSTVDEGAEAILQLALSPSLEGRSGLYFNGLREARPNAQAYDPEARERLRGISDELTGVAADSASR